MRGTWQTDSSGGGGQLVLAVLAVAAVVAVAGPALAAVAELVHVLLIAAVALLGLGAAGLVALLAWRLRHSRTNRVTLVSFPRAVPQRPAKSITAPQRSAIDRPQQVHLHLHGVSAEDIAAAIEQAQRKAGG